MKIIMCPVRACAIFAASAPLSRHGLRYRPAVAFKCLTLPACLQAPDISPRSSSDPRWKRKRKIRGIIATTRAWGSLGQAPIPAGPWLRKLRTATGPRDACTVLLLLQTNRTNFSRTHIRVFFASRLHRTTPSSIEPKSNFHKSPERAVSRKWHITHLLSIQKAISPPIRPKRRLICNIWAAALPSTSCKLPSHGIPISFLSYRKLFPKQTNVHESSRSNLRPP